MNKNTFSQKVFAIVSKIPSGNVLTYKEVARRAGISNAYRAMGNILNKNCNPRIPCHRVVRSDGILGGYNCGVCAKKVLLKRKRAV